MASANQKLQQWLLEIEKGLIDLSPGDRAKIIFDLDTQIRTQLSSDNAENAASNDQKIDAILASIGTPAQIIAKARTDRGLAANPPPSSTGPAPVPPTKPAKNPSKFWKWATIILVGGFFSFLALIIIVPILVMKFVSSSGFNHTFHISTFSGGASGDGSSYHLKGSQTEEGLEHLILHAANGNVAIKSGKGVFTYDCTIKGDENDGGNPISYPDDSTVVFNFDEVSPEEIVICTFEIPKEMSADVTLGNGEISASKMARDFKATVANGKVDFGKDPSVLFLVNASASVGQIQGLDEFNQAQVTMKTDASHARADLKVNAGQIIIEK